jgi:DNA-directed RNA polymerase subunit K/omega
MNHLEDGVTLVEKYNLYPFITKFEHAVIIATRAQQLEDNFPTLLTNVERYLGDEMDLAWKELHCGLLDSYSVRRPYPEGDPLDIFVGHLKLKRDY